MTFKRWIPTFLAFPLGGLIAINTVGSVDSPLTAMAGGLVAGTVIGAAQALALRTRRRWIPLTAIAMAAGGALAQALGVDVVTTGLLTGAAIGAAQATELRRGRLEWVAASAVAWSLGWLITSEVIVDLERGYVVFGSSGALAATLLTGVALRRTQVA